MRIAAFSIRIAIATGATTTTSAYIAESTLFSVGYFVIVFATGTLIWKW